MVVVVLPVPGAASNNSGSPKCSHARRCCSFNVIIVLHLLASITKRRNRREAISSFALYFKLTRRAFKLRRDAMKLVHILRKGIHASALFLCAIYHVMHLCHRLT